jgi:putative transposase
VSIRRTWIEPAPAGNFSTLPLSRQCELAGVTRSGVYRCWKGDTPVSELDLKLLSLIDEEYTRRPFYGSRRMVLSLRDAGYQVNRKRVQRLMKVLGLAGMLPGPHTSKPHPTHKVYPYLLRGVAITQPDQVWSADITYIRLAHGFAYLVAIMDWYSRRVLAWRLSNTLDSGFCIECLEDALRTYSAPEIFNTDQGLNLPALLLRRCLRMRRLRSAWMDGAGHWIIFSSSGCGVASNMRIFTLRGTSSLPSCTVASERISPIITMSAPIRRWAILRPHQSIERARAGVRK